MAQHLENTCRIIYNLKMLCRPDSNKENYVINEKSKIENGIFIPTCKDVKKLEL